MWLLWCAHTQERAAEKIKILDLEKALDQLDIDSVFKRDCFPLRKPRDFCAESEEESKEEIEVIKEPKISLQQEVEVS